MTCHRPSYFSITHLRGEARHPQIEAMIERHAIRVEAEMATETRQPHQDRRKGNQRTLGRPGARVRQIDPATGTVVRQYRSVRVACEAIGVPLNTFLFQVGKDKRCAGFKWWVGKAKSQEAA